MTRKRCDNETAMSETEEFQKGGRGRVPFQKEANLALAWLLGAECVMQPLHTRVGLGDAILIQKTRHIAQ